MAPTWTIPLARLKTLAHAICLNQLQG